MSCLDALKRMVSNYPGGRGAVAQRLKKPEETLRKELDGSPTHKMGVLDALAIVDMCAAIRSPHFDALAHEVSRESHGRHVAEEQAQDTASIQHLLSDETRECSEMVMAVLQSMDGDGEVSDNELRRIEREAADAVEAINRLVRACKANNAGNKSRRLGAVA